MDPEVGAECIATSTPFRLIARTSQTRQEVELLEGKGIAAILTIAGGVFYVIGGVLVAAVVASISSSLGSLMGGYGGTSYGDLYGINSSNSSLGLGLSSGSVDAIAGFLLAFGLVTGLLIVFGGYLINSESAGRRKAGGILVVVMLIVGGLTTLGGLLIGFILAVIGAYMGLTYKSPGVVVGLGPMGSLTLGSRVSPAGTPAGVGPLNYCIKCGSQIREGAVFCGACGARIVD